MCFESEYQRPESQYFEIIRDNLMRSIIDFGKESIRTSAAPIATNDSVEAIFISCIADLHCLPSRHFVVSIML